MARAYFTNDTQSDSPLYFQPLSGGASRPVIACVRFLNYSVVRRESTMCPASRPEVSIVTCPFEF